MLKTDKLKAEQLKLAKEVVIKDKVSKVKLVAGCDQAFVEDDVISVVVVLDKNLKVIEQKSAVTKARFPYIPGYLFYREGPAIIEAFNKLENKPDLLMVDGNGILHPRKIGIASQIGLLLDIPTIGIAKNLMCGKIENGKVYYEREIRGVEVFTREHAKPIYISPGHNISLGKSVEIIKKYLINPHKLPEPIHVAHKFAKRMSKERE